jgi:hypothetical protein
MSNDRIEPQPTNGNRNNEDGRLRKKNAEALRRDEKLRSIDVQRNACGCPELATMGALRCGT